MRAKKHIGVYPFSGRLLVTLTEEVSGFDHDKGTIRFQPEHPLPDETVRAIVAARMAEIDGSSPKPAE